MNRKALALVIKVAQYIAKDHPEIADDYRNGKTYPAIIDEYNLKLIYEVTSDSIITSALYMALRKLVPVNELKKIAIDHQEKGAANGGKAARDNEKGIFAEETTREKLSDQARRSLATRGIPVYSDEERTYLGEVLLDNSPDYPKIRRVLKASYGFNRSEGALRTYRSRLLHPKNPSC